MAAAPAQQQRRWSSTAVDYAGFGLPTGERHDRGRATRSAGSSTRPRRRTTSRRTRPNWPSRSTRSRGPNGAPIERTFNTRRDLQLRVHAPHRHDRLDHRRGARRSTACSCSPRPAASGTTRSRRASRRSRRSARPTASPSSPPRTPTQFTDANLATFDVVVFMSTTGEILNDAQQAAFERYIQGGGGFAGVHAASDTEYSWPWFGELVGGYFRNHPPGTPTRGGRHRGRRRALHDRPPDALDAHGRVVQLPAPGRPPRSTATRRSPTTARAPAR